MQCVCTDGDTCALHEKELSKKHIRQLLKIYAEVAKVLFFLEK